jgi:pimeloyl-ACP methyl ester carboxylesterase
MKKKELPVFVTAANRSKLMEIYDEALRHWPVPFETSFVATRCGKTHVIASGDPTSPPMVLLHPMGVGGFVWSSIIEVLSKQWRTYALDTIGDIGKSELADPDRYPKRGRDYSAWLDDVFVVLDIRRADVVAGSMGGWIAMNHAICAPDRLRRLVLLGPMGLAPWRATFSVLGPFLSQRLRPSAAKLDKIITRSLGEGEAVNREFRLGPEASQDHGADAGVPRRQGRVGRRCRAGQETGPALHRRMRDRSPAERRPRHERRRAQPRRHPHRRVPA